MISPPSMRPGDGSLPERVGGYKVLRRLATGGTSDVLLARGPHGLERIVVLKLLLQQFREDPTSERMFSREARAYARLSHPAIVKLYDFFGESGQLVMVLEFIDGFPLHKLRALLKVRGQQLDARAAAFLASRIFGALAAAHAAKDPLSGKVAPVVHRDLNPSNVLVPWDGQAKIADFGIAKVTGIEGAAQAGFIKGTYGYMAPEQVRGEEITIRTDVYAGCLLVWELLAGRKAIVRGSSTDVDVLQAMAEPGFPSIGALRPDLPKPLLDAVTTGLQPDPAKRTISADEMIHVLGSTVNLDEGHAALVEALAGIRPPAPDEPMLSAPPPAPAGSSAEATIPNPLAVQRALASPANAALSVPPRTSQPPGPLAEKGGSVRFNASALASPLPPRPSPSKVPAPRPSGPSSSGPSSSSSSPPALAAPVLAPNPSPPQARDLSPDVTTSLPTAVLTAFRDPIPVTVSEALPAAPSHVAIAPPPVGSTTSAGPVSPFAATLSASLGQALRLEPGPTPPLRSGRAGALVVFGLAVVAGGAGAAIAIWQHSSDARRTSPTPSDGTVMAAAPARPSAAPAASSATPPTQGPLPAAIQSASATNELLPPPAANMGRITVSPEYAGHRIWVDKHFVGQSPGTFEVPCGVHWVRLGSAGTVQKVDIKCAAETEVKWEGVAAP